MTLPGIARLALALVLLAPGVARLGAQAPARATGELARAADAAWEAGRRDEAFDAYAEVLRRDSAAVPRALLRVGTVLAQRGRFGEALPVLRRFVALEPGEVAGRLALARALAWAHRYGESLAVYDSMLAAAPGERDAAVGRAQVLGWAGRPADAVRAWERWLADHPGDAEAELGLARALSVAGRLEEAERRYARLAAAGRSLEAEKGLARVAGWRGELARSEALWRAVAERAPSDPEAWTGLAQVLRWRGRPEDAQVALGRALAAEAGYADALAQLGWVRAELRPAVEPRVTYAADNEDNRTVLTMATVRARVGARLGVGLTGSRRRVRQRFVEGTVSGAQAVARFTPEGGRWWAQGAAGVAAQRAEDAAGAETASRARPSLGAYALARVGGRLTVGAGGSYAPFDETALLVQRGATLAEATADAALLVAPGLDAEAGVAVGRVTGGASAGLRRVSATATLRRALGRGWRLEGGARYFGYGSAPTIYFFAPRTFALAEAGPRYERLADLGWFASGAAYLGGQTLRPQANGGGGEARLARRADATLGWRFAPGYEVAAVGGFANVASPSAGASLAEYRAWVATLRARIRL